MIYLSAAECLLNEYDLNAQVISAVPSSGTSYATVTTVRFDFVSTAVRRAFDYLSSYHRSLRSQRHNPQAAVTLTYLRGRSAAAENR